MRDIAAVNPNIVMCSVSTYGQDSPHAQRIGNDLVALAAGGFLHMMGEPDGHPVYPASAIADHMTAVNAFGAISAALFHRARTGEGQHIDLALVDCAYNSHDWQLAAYSTSGGELDPQRGGTQRTGAFPYGVFKSKDGYIGIGIFTEPQWEALVRRMGREDLLEVAEFKTPGGRFENQAAAQADYRGMARDAAQRRRSDSHSRRRTAAARGSRAVSRTVRAGSGSEPADGRESANGQTAAKCCCSSRRTSSPKRRPPIRYRRPR